MPAHKIKVQTYGRPLMPLWLA